jgi:threonine dehydrogenase-like Zn-dependent dehydrogenase
MYGAHDVRVETVPDAEILKPTDALVRVTRACICGSDLWPYNSMAPNATGNRMGHEFIGVVESIGADVRTVKKGDLVRSDAFLKKKRRSRHSTAARTIHVVKSVQHGQAAHRGSG